VPEGQVWRGYKVIILDIRSNQFSEFLIAFILIKFIEILYLLDLVFELLGHLIDLGGLHVHVVYPISLDLLFNASLNIVFMHV